MMTNLEEFNEAHSIFREAIKAVTAAEIDNPSILNVMISAYLPSIAKSLAIIADRMTACERNRRERGQDEQN